MQKLSPPIFGKVSQNSLPIDERKIHLLSIKEAPLVINQKRKVEIPVSKRRSNSQYNVLENNKDIFKIEELSKRVERSLSEINENRVRKINSPKNIPSQKENITEKSTLATNISYEKSFASERLDIRTTNAENLDIVNLTSQIKELEKMNQNERKKYRNNLEKLTHSLDEAQKEISLLKSKSNDQTQKNDPNFEKILYDYRLMLSENIKLKQNIDQMMKSKKPEIKTQSISTNTINISILETNNAHLNENKKLQEKVLDLQNMIYEISKEKERTFEYLVDMKNEKNILDEKLKWNNKKFEDLTSEISEWERKFSHLQAQFKDSSEIFSNNQNQYKEILKEKDLKIEFLNDSIKTLEEKLNEKNDQIQKVEKNLSALIDENSKEKERLQKIQITSQTLQESSSKEISSLKSEIKYLEAENQSLNQKLSLSEENKSLIFASKEDEIRTLKTKVLTTDEELSRGTKIIEAYKLELKEAKVTISESKKENYELKEGLRNVTKSFEIEKASLIHTINVLNSKVKDQEINLKNCSQEKSTLEEEIISLKTKCSDYLKQTEDQIISKSFINSSLKELQAEHFALKSKYEELSLKEKEWIFSRNNDFSFGNREIKEVCTIDMKEFSNCKDALELAQKEIQRLKNDMKTKENEAIRCQEIKGNILLDLQKELLLIKKENEELRANNENLRSEIARKDDKPLFFNGANVLESKIFDEENDSLENTKLEVYSIFEDALVNSSNLVLSKDMTFLKESLGQIYAKGPLKVTPAPSNFKKKDILKENNQCK